MVDLSEESLEQAILAASKYSVPPDAYFAPRGFGLARIIEEGAPVHPEDLDWECDLDECEQCRRRFDRQLLGWNAWEIYRGRNPFV